MTFEDQAKPIWKQNVAVSTSLKSLTVIDENLTVIEIDVAPWLFPKEMALENFVGAFSLVELLFNGLAERHLVNVSQDEIRFDDLSKLFQSSIKGMLLGIGIELAGPLGGTNSCK